MLRTMRGIAAILDGGRRRLVVQIAVAFAALLAAMPASAVDTSVAALLRPTMTYVSRDALDNYSRTYGSFTGVGTLFVTRESSASSGYGSACTGSLVASNVVLTAAHCLFGSSNGVSSGTADAVTSVTFYMSSGGAYTGSGDPQTGVYQAVNQSWTLDPTYTGVLGEGNDLALFTLTTAAIGHDIYSIYAGEPLTAFTRVGTGTTGVGATGTDAGSTGFGYQRAGTNLYEAFGDSQPTEPTEPTDAAWWLADYGFSHNTLFSDFDDGTAEHDVFGQTGYGSQRGIDGESISSPGDSGGPTFVGNLILGITSFGVTGEILTGSGACGAGHVDPSFSNGNCTNSSFGELAGDTWLAPKSAFVNDYIAANSIPSSVPEPDSWELMIAGFGLIGSTLRGRRRQQIAVSAR